MYNFDIFTLKNIIMITKWWSIKELACISHKQNCSDKLIFEYFIKLLDFHSFFSNMILIALKLGEGVDTQSDYNNERSEFKIINIFEVAITYILLQ